MQPVRVRKQGKNRSKSLQNYLRHAIPTVRFASRYHYNPYPARDCKSLSNSISPFKRTEARSVSYGHKSSTIVLFQRTLAIRQRFEPLGK